MNIRVTSNDIENGQRHDPERCPVARALSRAGVLHFGVMLATIVVADGHGHVTSLPLPSQVTDWILDFDNNRLVRPMSFELSIPLAAVANGPAPVPDGALPTCFDFNGFVRGKYKVSEAAC